jgi:hypothetical protein
MKVSAYKKIVCIMKDILSLGKFLNSYFIISCEICTFICTKHVVVGLRIANEFDFEGAFWSQRQQWCYLTRLSRSV